MSAVVVWPTRESQRPKLFWSDVRDERCSNSENS